MARETVAAEEVRFALDSPLEGDGFEPSVPREKISVFKSWSRVSGTGLNRAGANGKES
jgi:hypothetical protein